MKRQNWGLYAISMAVLIVGLVWAGVPVNTLLFAGLVLVCPVMMFFMMRGMHGGDDSSHTGEHDKHNDPSTLDRR